MSNKEAVPTNARKYPSDRRLEEMEHDPYHARMKLKEPTLCPDCSAVYSHGRWTWGEAPKDAHQTRCPACQRTHDRVPAAFLTLTGDFRKQHKEEIMHLIENYEQRERAEHPLKRIMKIDDGEQALVVSFTDQHLARGTGEALYNAYQGGLDHQYTKSDNLLRVTWHR
ncbi:MAG TPA: BCAM0308 family protein [Pseudodesulfovibrio sp.]|nr:BCAM0308 family protein [Pseudodesulfovibrio sp.]